MRVLLLALVSMFFLSSCSVHVYHHNKKHWKKAACEKCVSKCCTKKSCEKCESGNCKDCKDCKSNKECKTCNVKSDCSTGQCSLVNGKRSKKSCCNS